jgi:hypothetical protein
MGVGGSVFRLEESIPGFGVRSSVLISGGGEGSVVLVTGSGVGGGGSDSVTGLGVGGGSGFGFKDSGFGFKAGVSIALVFDAVFLAGFGAGDSISGITVGNSETGT